MSRTIAMRWLKAPVKAAAKAAPKQKGKAPALTGGTYRTFIDLTTAQTAVLSVKHGFLDISAVKDGLPASLCDLVTYSTNRDASLRYSAREFAQQLNEVEEELTRPEPQHVLDPRTARLRSAQVAASTFGWRLFEDYLVESAEIDDLVEYLLSL